jgi:hypothetical protein
MKELKSSQCAFYARTLAEQLFGLRYAPGHAWDYPTVNRVVWWQRSPTDSTFYGLMKPGQVVGIRYPDSKEQKEHPERPFTHVALFLGSRKGRPIIAHQFIDTFRLDDLYDFLPQKKCSVVALLEPPQLGQKMGNFARRVKNRLRKN